jgi:hypothetical protein
MKLFAKRSFISSIFCLSFWFSGSQFLEAYSIPPGFGTCSSLDVCLRSLDSVASTADGSIGPDEEAYTQKLTTFGESAKHELLKRATGADPKWRNLSQAILANWKAWSPSDVPELQTALRLDPGGWMAGPLRMIGTPAAIEALVEDLPKGSENQTDFALEKLGPKAIPFLMPLLENENTSPSAIRVIRLMGDSAASFQSSWSQVANDPGEPLSKRLAALKAMSALGAKARSSAASIEPLSKSQEPSLREQAVVTLEAIQSFEEKTDSHVQEVSVIALLADPTKYDGKHVRIIGFLRLEFEGNAIFLHREDFEYAISKNALWIDRPEDLSERQVAEVNKRYVICEGTFNAKEHGHMGMFGGALTHVTRLDSWERAARTD